MVYPQEDRKKKQQERQNPTHPLPPMNVIAQWAFYAPNNGVDIRWDDPSQLGGHTDWDIVGVNIYRSTDSEYGPYHKLNDEPVGSTFWRDETENELVDKEDVSDQFVARGDDNEQGRWIFKTDNFPIVKPDSEGTPANHPSDVTVWIDGQEVTPAFVSGESGEVELSTDPIYDKQANKKVDPPLPDPDSTVLCTYRYNTNKLRRRHYQRIFYRVTAVGRRQWDNELRETPLEECESKSIHHMEELDYIWKEGIRRNGWILDQSGERAKVFIRKYMGEKCDCWDEDFDNAVNDCKTCYGTGYIGGYEGPYDITIAPMDSEKKINWEDRGVYLEQTYDTWTGPSPLLSQRDFLVKPNNDRLAISGVRTPTNRGTILQQHFNLEMIDEDDIRYSVPVTGTGNLKYPETRNYQPEDDPSEIRNPQITEEERVPDELEERGRTPTYENLNNSGG
jgi:hypothetical protein